MITLSDLKLDFRVESIFKSNGWLDSESILLNLERYKFLSRDELLIILNNKLLGANKEVTKETIKHYPDIRDEYKAIVRSVEAEHKILIKQVSSNSVEILTSILNEIDLTTIMFKLPYSNSKVKYLTPFNYLELSGGSKYKWDYSALLRRIVMECMDKKGTDIHISSRNPLSGPEYYVSYRVGNRMVDSDLITLSKSENKELVSHIIHKETNLYSGDLESIYGVTASITDVFGDRKTSLRISANKNYNGYTCVCRVQNVTTSSRRINELGFPSYVQDDLYEVSKKRYGLTLVTGAIRMGKSTTLFALANEMSNDSINIFDYSSPLEVLMPFTQVDYLSNVDHLYELVRLSKKQDVDVLFVNEIPDKRVALAIQDLVNSSIHVLTTFHLDRLWHLPYKLREYFGSDIKSVITRIGFCANQKMYETQCPHCRSMFTVSDVDVKYRKILEAYGVTKYYKEKGCAMCSGESKDVKVQPYVERIMFDDKLTSELLKCSEDYEMEFVLKSKMHEENLCFEYELSKAIEKGDLPLSALDSIL